MSPLLGEIDASTLSAADSSRDVEDDRIVVGRGCHPDRVVAGADDVGRVPLLRQAALEQAAHLHLVLDDEHPHALILALEMRER